jgi:hypothetical protein
MTIADILKASQGLPMTTAVEIEVSGMILQILSVDSISGALVLTASTPHTIGMLAAQEANQSSLKSLQSVNAALAVSQAKVQKLTNRRVQDYVDKGMVHVPSHSEDEQKLLSQIQNGDI